MVFLGIVIIFGSFEQPGMFAYQVMILGAMATGLGIVSIGLGIVNDSIRKNSAGISYDAIQEQTKFIENAIQEQTKSFENVFEQYFRKKNPGQ